MGTAMNRTPTNPINFDDVLSSLALVKLLMYEDVLLVSTVKFLTISSAIDSIFSIAILDTIGMCEHDVCTLCTVENSVVVTVRVSVTYSGVGDIVTVPVEHTKVDVTVNVLICDVTVASVTVDVAVSVTVTFIVTVEVAVTYTDDGVIVTVGQLVDEVGAIDDTKGGGVAENK